MKVNQVNNHKLDTWVKDLRKFKKKIKSVNSNLHLWWLELTLKCSADGSWSFFLKTKSLSLKIFKNFHDKKCFMHSSILKITPISWWFISRWISWTFDFRRIFSLKKPGKTKMGSLYSKFSFSRMMDRFKWMKKRK